MKTLLSIIRSKYILWAFVSIPGIFILLNYLEGKLNYGMIMNITGELSGRLLVFSLIATPISMLLPKTKFSRWLLRNRRYFGIGAFAYTLLHIIFYLLEYRLERIINEFSDTALLTGWIAFFIFIPLAITSTDSAIRRMGANWKKLQRWVYLAAIMAYIHWAMLGLQGPEGSIAGATVHFAPVIILQIYRVIKSFNKKKKSRTTA